MILDSKFKYMINAYLETFYLVISCFFFCGLYTMLVPHASITECQVLAGWINHVYSSCGMDLCCGLIDHVVSSVPTVHLCKFFVTMNLFSLDLLTFSDLALWRKKWVQHCARNLMLLVGVSLI